MRTLQWIGFMIIVSISVLWAATPPGLINYQGVLRDGSGAPRNGSFDMVFRFYNALSSGTLLWTDSHTGANQVTVSNGLFTVALGSGTITAGAESTLAGMFANRATVYVEVQVGTETLAPRVLVLASAYAQNAGTLQGNNASAFASAGHMQTPAAGGTGLNTSSTPAGNLLYTSAAGTWDTLSAGSSGQILQSTGSGLQWADATDANALSKEGAIVWNNAMADVDARFSSATNPNLLYLDGTGAGMVGIGTSLPEQRLHVYQSVSDPAVPTHAIYGYLYVNASTRTTYDDLSALNTIGEFAGNQKIGQGSSIVADLNWNNSNTTGQGVSVLGHVGTGTGTDAGADFLAGFRTSLDHHSTGTVDRMYGYYCNQVDVDGGGTINNVYGFDAGMLSGAGKQNVWSFYAEDPHAPSAFMGAVGIGTAVPAFPLDVDGDVRLTGALRDAAGEAGTAGQVLQSTGTGFQWATPSPTDGGWTVSGSNMYSAVSGNVGIGTTAPSGKLDVHYDSNNYALLGYAPAILAKYAHYEDPANGDGQAALYAARSRSAQNNGTGYGYGYTNQAIEGYNISGDAYTFGITAHSYLNFDRSGAILGASAGASPWGALGYRASGGIQYGGYFTSTRSGSGRSGDEEGIGLGSYGTLMGGWVRGEEYGLYSSGKRFGNFTNGNGFTTGYQAFVQENAGAKIISYSIASPSVDVIIHGTASLAAGQTAVEFPSEFQTMVSPDEPVSVFLSPIGSSVGISLSSVTPQGFEVLQTGKSSSGLDFSWIAIGRRKGFEEVETPNEILQPDFEANMERVAYNENNLKDSGLGMYYDDALHFGTPPGSQDQADRAADGEVSAPMPGEDSRPAAGRRPSDVPSAPTAEPVVGHPVTAAPDGAGLQPSAQGPAIFKVKEAVEQGDVLVLNPGNGEELDKCILPADPMVAGIAITNEQDGFAHVAGAGYAMVKADATLSPIVQGDLLTASANPGHAMKASRPIEPGTIIGKALESLETGTGMIKVLVMLR